MKESNRIVLQRKHPKKHVWANWDWITLGRDKPEDKQIDYLKKWIKEYGNEHDEYRIVRIETRIAVI